MKTKYTMTDGELAELREACKPVHYMVFGGIPPESPYDKAVRVWGKIAERVQCDVNSIEGAGPGRDNEFYADPLKNG